MTVVRGPKGKAPQENWRKRIRAQPCLLWGSGSFPSAGTLGWENSHWGGCIGRGKSMKDNHFLKPRL